jgi:hypothetical protein
VCVRKEKGVRRRGVRRRGVRRESDGGTANAPLRRAHGSAGPCCRHMLTTAQATISIQCIYSSQYSAHTVRQKRGGQREPTRSRLRASCKARVVRHARRARGVAREREERARSSGAGRRARATRAYTGARRPEAGRGVSTPVGAGERERTSSSTPASSVRATNHAWPEVASTHSPLWSARQGRGRSQGRGERRAHLERVRRVEQLEGGEVGRGRAGRGDLEDELVDERRHGAAARAGPVGVRRSGSAAGICGVRRRREGRARRDGYERRRHCGLWAEGRSGRRVLRGPMTWGRRIELVRDRLRVDLCKEKCRREGPCGGGSFPGRVGGEAFVCGHGSHARGVMKERERIIILG